MEMQRLGGLLQSWLPVFPSLAHDLKVLYLLQSSDDGIWRKPKGSPETVETLWEEFWVALEVVYLILGLPEEFSLDYTRPLCFVLTIPELVGLPGGLLDASRVNSSTCASA